MRPAAPAFLACLLAAPATAQSLCPQIITLREAPGTPGLSQSPGSGLGGRITRQEWDGNWRNVEAICRGDIRAEDWGTGLADGCLLEAAGGALVCGSGSGGAGGATDFADLTGDLALGQTDGTCSGAGDEVIVWTAGVPACAAISSSPTVSEGSVEKIQALRDLNFHGATFDISEPATGEALVEIGAGGVALGHLSACPGPGEIVEYTATGPTCISTPGGGANPAQISDSDGSAFVRVTEADVVEVGWLGAVRITIAGSTIAFGRPLSGISSAGPKIWFDRVPEPNRCMITLTNTDSDTCLTWEAANVGGLKAGAGVPVTWSDEDGGTLHVANLLELPGHTSAPAPCTASTRRKVAYSDALEEPCYCNGSAWRQMDGGGTCF